MADLTGLRDHEPTIRPGERPAAVVLEDLPDVSALGDYEPDRPSFRDDLSSEEKFWLGVLAALLAAVLEAALLALLYLGAASPDPPLPEAWPFWADVLPIALVGLVTLLGLVGLTVAALAVPTYKLLLWGLDRVGVEVLADLRHLLQRFFY